MRVLNPRPVETATRIVREPIAHDSAARQVSGGAIYIDEEDMLSLRNVPAEFDALVVIKTGHDSSPTPTGVRKASD